MKIPWICQTCHLQLYCFPSEMLVLHTKYGVCISVCPHVPATPLLKVMVRCQFCVMHACTSLVGPSLIIDRHHGNRYRLPTISAAKCWKGKKTPNNTKTRRTATHFTAGVGCTDGEDRQTAGQTSRQRGRHSCRQADGIGKWVDGQKGEESRSQTDRKTDGKLTGRQKGGRDDK